MDYQPDHPGIGTPQGSSDEAGLYVRMKPDVHNQTCWDSAIARSGPPAPWEHGEQRGRRALQLLEDPAECRCNEQLNRGRRGGRRR